MIAEATCPFAELEDEMPDVVYALAQPQTGKWVCHKHCDDHGLACFTCWEAADSFKGLTESFGLNGLCTLGMPWEEAVKVAKERPAPVNCIMICDDVFKPTIPTFYVK